MMKGGLGISEGMWMTGIKLKVEVEEKGRTAFLDFELRRGRTNESIRTKWFQKKDNARIFCNWRNNEDEGTKKNLVRNFEKKIKKLTTREEDKRNFGGTSVGTTGKERL